MERKLYTGSRPNASGLPSGLPLFDWANAHPTVPADFRPLAVVMVARRFRLPLPVAGTIAELAGFRMEARHA